LATWVDYTRLGRRGEREIGNRSKAGGEKKKGREKCTEEVNCEIKQDKIIQITNAAFGRDPKHCLSYTKD